MNGCPRMHEECRLQVFAPAFCPIRLATRENDDNPSSRRLRCRGACFWACLVGATRDRRAAVIRSLDSVGYLWRLHCHRHRKDGVCLWLLTSSNFVPRLPQPLALTDILLHALHYVRRDLQKYYIRILLFVPVYALSRWALIVAGLAGLGSMLPIRRTSLPPAAGCLCASIQTTVTLASFVGSMKWVF